MSLKEVVKVPYIREENISVWAQCEKDDEAILGVVTLEILGLVFNPLKRTLSPMKALLI